MAVEPFIVFSEGDGGRVAKYHGLECLSRYGREALQESEGAGDSPPSSAGRTTSPQHSPHGEVSMKGGCWDPLWSPSLLGRLIEGGGREDLRIMGRLARSPVPLATDLSEKSRAP